MPNVSINAPLNVNKTFSEWVWYNEDNALLEGQAVCYDFDYGDSALVVERSRRNRVEDPDTSNAQHFAGVSARAYAANTGGQFIEIYIPGSVCMVHCNAPASLALGVSFVTFDVTTSFVGFFRYAGLPGRGSAIPFETEDTSITAGPTLCYLMTGAESGGVEVVQAVANTAWVAMVGGTTCVIGVASGSSSPTEEILDGTIEGLYKKVIVIDTAATTNELAVDIENNDGITLAGGALASVALGAVGDQWVGLWTGGKWRTMGATGETES